MSTSTAHRNAGHVALRRHEEALLGRSRRCVGIALIAGMLASGCMFRRLGRDLARIDELGLVGGHASRAATDTAPIVVVLHAGTPPTVVDSFVLENPGAYFFTAPPGTYRIAAFVDRNRDFVYQPELEPAASYGDPTDVVVESGRQVQGLDVRVGAKPGDPLGFPVSVADLGRRGTKALPAVNVGEVVRFGDPRFSPENARLGLWQPAEFLFQVGAGIYFLDRFDPKKTPVVFVHGAGGNPDQWQYVVERLDRTRFQPWLAYYPSGLDLETLGRAFARWTVTLAARDRIDRLIVVAHSMGGLVSRAAINEMIAGGNGDLLAGFVTLSTPWNGQAFAARGVREAPVVMPMWRSMSPGSPFLTALYDTSLPSGCPYHLLFSYNGRSRWLDEPNDGVVAISSELAPRAQQAAEKIYGFDTSHAGILTDARVATMLNAILAEAAR